MGKLHEVLAVETDLRSTADKLLKEAQNTFKSKSGHFDASDVRFKPDSETAPEEAPEIKPMIDKVRDKIKYTTASYGKYLDAFFQKETANQTAKSDLKLENGDALLKDVPACVLLGLESRLREVRELYEAAPTLAPGPSWEKDAQSGNWKAVSERVRTAKIQEPLILHPATKEHPAQVQLTTSDKRTGVVKTTQQSSVLTSAEKSALIGRVDELIQATKKARMRANDTEVKHDKIGEKIFGYIHGDLFT